MARVFDITAASDAVRLDGKGQGEIAFTASNVSGRPLHGRANLVPQDAASKAWLSVSGEPERDFPASGTQQFSVKVLVPAGTKAGKYNFRLDVVSVQNPDEDYTQGPNVAVSVTLAPPPPKPFPWWILVVAAVVLIAVGGVTWYLLKPKPAPVTVTQTPVPDVTSSHMPLEAAMNTIWNAGFNVDQPSSRIEPPNLTGKVVDQSPTGTAPAGSTVHLTVGTVRFVDWRTMVSPQTLKRFQKAK